MSRSAPFPAASDDARGRDAPTWRRHVPASLLLLFVMAMAWSGWSPNNRADWILENVLVIVALPLLAWSHRRVPLSNAAYASLFVFGLLHEVGAHYTYSEVPYERWLHAWWGTSAQDWFGWSRNHYDRAIHFLFGLLATPAAVELVEARAWPRGWWRWLLPVAFISSQAALYELLEWAAALVFAGDLRMAYLGTQGDPWDAQQDVFQAMAGSAITATMMLRRRPRQRILGPGDDSSIG